MLRTYRVAPDKKADASENLVRFLVACAQGFLGGDSNFAEFTEPKPISRHYADH